MLRCSRAQRVPRIRRRRRHDDVPRCPESQHGRRRRAALEWRTAAHGPRTSTTPGPPMFDWRELQRWGIPESRLPAGSVVRYRAPESVAGIPPHRPGRAGRPRRPDVPDRRALVERRARQRAEIESRKNLALAADASRRQTMSALTSSIGHELGQPLTPSCTTPRRCRSWCRPIGQLRRDGRDPVRHPRRRSCRPRRSSIATGRCCAVVNWSRSRSTFTPSSMPAWRSSLTT